MFPWNDIDTVLLDMDGTLLDLHFDNYFWLQHLPHRYAEAHKVSIEEANEVLHAHMKAHEGTLKWYCLEHWSAALDVDIRKLKEEVKHKIQIRPFVAEFLQHLQRLNKKLVLITNAHPQSLDLKLEVTRIDRWLDMVISSHQIQHPKEAQEFWQALHQQLCFDPARTLFVDDTERILRSAQTFGVRHLLCMWQPDSQQKKRELCAFPAIHHFDELFPTILKSSPIDDAQEVPANSVKRDG